MLRDIREGCGVIGGVLVTLAVALRPHHATSTPLFWFGIALLLVSGAAYLLSIVERLRGGSNIEHGLVPKNPQIVGEVDYDAGFIDLRVGLELLNNTSVPLRYQAELFSVRIGDLFSPLTESPENSVAAGRENGWFRHPIRVSLEKFPAMVEIDFRFLYKRVGKKMRRSVEATHRSRIPKLDEGREQYPGFVEEVRPTQDCALPSSRSAHVRRWVSTSRGLLRKNGNCRG
jgi:hypothetical protein